MAGLFGVWSCIALGQRRTVLCRTGEYKWREDTPGRVRIRDAAGGDLHSVAGGTAKTDGSTRLNLGETRLRRGGPSAGKSNDTRGLHFSALQLNHAPST
jgi:hypothetical protein